MKTILKLKIFLLAGILSGCFFTFSLYAQVSITPFAIGFAAITDIKNAGDDRLFVVEQAGGIKIVDPSGVVNPMRFLDLTGKVKVAGEQGMLGLAFSPDYKNDRRFYVNYIDSAGYTRISRFRTSETNPDSAETSSEEILIRISQPYSNHKGGCLQFGNDGYLYCSLGDGGNAGDPGDRAQDLKDTLGKMLRIDVGTANGYAIPPDNPFVNDTSAINLIWAYGLRNPWRFSFDRRNHDMWIGDVGQGIYEEIDLQPAQSPGGENYGWRCYEGNHPYNSTGCNPQGNYVPAVYEYTHSPTGSCSVTGGYIYRGAKYGAMFGKYFFIDYCSGLFHSIKKDTGSSYLYTHEGNFPSYFSTFGEDQYGELYMAGYTSGIVYKIKNSDCTPTAFIYDRDTLYVCGESTILNTPLYDSFKYQWYFNGAPVAGADSNLLPADKNGWYRVRVTTADDSCSNISSDVYVFFSSTESVSITGLPSFICNSHNPAWLSGNPAGGVFTGEGITGNIFNPDSVPPGSYPIYYNYLTGYGCTLIKDQTITVTNCADDSPVIIAPNPTANNLTVDFSFNENEDLEITIYDASGKICLKEHLLIISGTMQHIFNLPGLSSGVYTLQLKNSRVLIKEKFVITKAK
jgi:glucose/arabinose dehydrogenase